MMQTVGPTQTMIESDDWGIGIRCVGWDRKEYTLVISTNAHVVTEQSARQLALNSLMRRGALPPVIKSVVAHRFSDLGIPLMRNGACVKRAAEFKTKVKF